MTVLSAWQGLKLMPNRAANAVSVWGGRPSKNSYSKPLLAISSQKYRQQPIPSELTKVAFKYTLHKLQLHKPVVYQLAPWLQPFAQCWLGASGRWLTMQKSLGG